MRNPNRATGPTVRLYASCFAIVFSLMLPTLGSQPSGIQADATTGADDAVRQQITRYTEALNAADIDLASRIWETSPDVTFIHPRGHARGWEEVQEIYKFFGSVFSERKLTARDISVHIHGDTAWAEFYWDFVAKQKSDGSTVQTEGRETQIYSRIDNRWRLVHIHYSGPAMKR